MPNLVFDHREVQQQFLKALRDRNLQVEGPLLDDGEIHRCNATNKEGNRGRGDGWYVLYPTGWPAGAFANRTDGKGKENWKFRRGKNEPRISASEMQRLMGEQRRAQAEASAKRRRDREQAAIQAATTWDDAEPATASHSYLRDKRIKKAHGLRLNGDSLMVPVYVTGCEAPVSLQFIDPDGAKRFLKNGRVEGGYYYLRSSGTEETRDTICICEGFATGASINEATGYAVYVAFNTGNLLRVSRTVKEANPTARIIICSDDDFETKGNPGVTYANKAAASIGAHIAIPEFDLSEVDRMSDYTDFNDVAFVHGPDRVRNTITAALERGIVMDEIEEEDVTESKTARDRRIAEIAVIADPIEREQKRNELAKILKVSRPTIDDEINKARAQLAKAEEKPKRTKKELRASAREIIESEDVLDLFAKDVTRILAGERKNAKLLYLVGTSRLFDDTMHAAIKGPSAAGKSQLRDKVLRYFPPEDIVSFTSLSEKALIYFKGDLSHKILSMGEARAPDDKSFQDYCLRQLMSENRLRHIVPTKFGDQIESIQIDKDGPVVFMVTTTATKLHQENETRILSLNVDESEAQTRRVLAKIAQTEGLNRNQIDPESFHKWHDYQRWLAAGERRVFIPFSATLGELLTTTSTVRLRRDFSQLLRGIKACALLHREHRRRSTKGSIIAAIEDDYAIVRSQMADVMSTAAELKIRARVETVVKKLKRLEAAIDPRTTRARAAFDEMERGAGTSGVPIRDIATALKLDMNPAWRLLKEAQESGYVVNLETRRGQPGRYASTPQRMSSAADLLPTPAELREAYDEHRKAKAPAKPVKAKKRKV